MLPVKTSMISWTPPPQVSKIPILKEWLPFFYLTLDLFKFDFGTILFFLLPNVPSEKKQKQKKNNQMVPLDDWQIT